MIPQLLFSHVLLHTAATDILIQHNITVNINTEKVNLQTEIVKSGLLFQAISLLTWSANTFWYHLQTTIEYLPNNQLLVYISGVTVGFLSVNCTKYLPEQSFSTAIIERFRISTLLTEQIIRGSLLTIIIYYCQ